MAIISQLTIYPVKSCAGLTLTEAVIGLAGLETPHRQSDGAQSVADREWMIVTAAGDFLTQREHPRMALIVPSVVSGALRLAAPGMPDLAIPLSDFALRTSGSRVRIWDDNCAAFDEGDVAREWLSDYLHTPARLARFDPVHERWSSQERTGAVRALNRFSDGYPLLIISEASLRQLNERFQQAGREPLPMNRFRPNIVIKGVEAHDEDRFAALRILTDSTVRDGTNAAAGTNLAKPKATVAVELRPVKACPRCPIPSIDQAAGTRGPDPLDILAQYRGSADGILFGQNAIVVSGFGALLQTGQRLQEEWNF